jgi:hypothetical protein
VAVRLCPLSKIPSVMREHFGTGDARETLTKMPFTKVAEGFCKFLDKRQR